MKLKDTSAQAAGMVCDCDSCSMEPAGHENDADLARRGFLRNTIAGTVVALVGGTATHDRRASAQSTLTPEAALKALMDGNQRYVGGQLESLNEDLAMLKAKTAEKQEPFAVFSISSRSKATAAIHSRIPIASGVYATRV